MRGFGDSAVKMTMSMRRFDEGAIVADCLDSLYLSSLIPDEVLYDDDDYQAQQPPTVGPLASYRNPIDIDPTPTSDTLLPITLPDNNQLRWLTRQDF